jgi:hypothetical protein
VKSVKAAAVVDEAATTVAGVVEATTGAADIASASNKGKLCGAKEKLILIMALYIQPERHRHHWTGLNFMEIKLAFPQSQSNNY